MAEAGVAAGCPEEEEGEVWGAVRESHAEHDVRREAQRDAAAARQAARKMGAMLGTIGTRGAPGFGMENGMLQEAREAVGGRGSAGGRVRGNVCWLGPWLLRCRLGAGARR